jgi:beta-lactam-binding protein with PASTA domain
VKHKKYKDAERILDDLGLVVVVSDTGYVKTLPPDVILEQSIEAGEKVKSGRIIYLTVNALKTPTITLPDIIDNSSYREALAKLTAMGFKILPPKKVPGEKDWVYGILSRGRRLSAGELISADTPLTLIIGSGMYNEEDEELDFLNDYSGAMDTKAEENTPEEDDFEELTEP